VKNRNLVASSITLAGGLLLVAAWFCVLGAADPTAAPPPSNGAISPQDQADALHFIIEADREACCRAFLARTGTDASASPASEAVPVPCAMLRLAAESVQAKGAEFSYALRSLHPIELRNAPQTELERQGLEFVAGHPGRNFYGRETLGGRRYFTAVYPDLPAAAGCVDCHQRRTPVTRLRYGVGDAMGGIVVRVPLEF